MDDWIVAGALQTSFWIAIAWTIGNPAIIIAGYYWRDRNHDNDVA